jgi:Mycothiol maleylpyruvate isomerase N-terminal domain
MQATELNRAFQSTLEMLEKVKPQDLEAPTPCASWDVRALVNHFIGTARWWDLARAIGQPADLDPGLARELLDHARLAITDAFRGSDGQAAFGPVAEAPVGSGPADQLAAFLGRRV